MSRSLRPVAEPYILLGDTCIIGFFFVAGTVFFEKQERTLSAVISTPLRFWEYLAAKLTLLVLISLLVAIVVPTISHGFGYRPLPLMIAVVLGTLLMLLVGFATSLPFASISDWFLGGDHPTRGDDRSSGPLLLGRVAERVGVPDPHTRDRCCCSARPSTRSPRAVAGRVRGGVPDAVCGGPVVGGQSHVRPLRRRAVGRNVMATRIDRTEGTGCIRPQRYSRHLP